MARLVNNMFRREYYEENFTAAEICKAWEAFGTIKYLLVVNETLGGSCVLPKNQVMQYIIDCQRRGEKVSVKETNQQVAETLFGNNKPTSTE